MHERGRHFGGAKQVLLRHDFYHNEGKYTLIFSFFLIYLYFSCTVKLAPDCLYFLHF